jgi:hypothetical protein
MIFDLTPQQANVIVAALNGMKAAIDGVLNEMQKQAAPPEPPPPPG